MSVMMIAMMTDNNAESVDKILTVPCLDRFFPCIGWETEKSGLGTRLTISMAAGSEAGSLYSRFSAADKRDSRSLMFDALQSKNFELIPDLVEIGVPINIKNEDSCTPLLVAVQQNCPRNLIGFLMTSGSAVIGLTDKHEMTPLHEAVQRDNYIALREMINVIQDNDLPEVNRKNREQQIRDCCDGKHKERSPLLNKKNKVGWTPLHCAADRGHVNVLQVLLMAAGCDVTTTNKVIIQCTGLCIIEALQKKQTAFHLAARNGHLDCLQLLYVAAECSQSLDDLPKTDKNKWDLACHASAQDDVEVMEWLLRNMPEHAGVNHCTEKGYTPLLLSCKYQKIGILKFLLDHECISEVASTTSDGKTALHLAAIHDSVKITQLLLNKDFPLDQVDENGETALHIAYKKGSHQVWVLLLDEGADPCKKNKEGKCPEDLKYQDLKIPVEVEKRGEKAVKGYIEALKKGKKKMPRCKLMIVGEAGVGKTNLLNLLTGEEFVPKHEETKGIDIDLVSTHDISTETWKKSNAERYEEFTSVAAALVADELRNDIPTQPKKKRIYYATDGKSLHNRFDGLIQRYTKQARVATVTFAFPRLFQPSKTRSVKDINQTEPLQPASPHSALSKSIPLQAVDDTQNKVGDKQLQNTLKAVPKSSSIVNPSPYSSAVASSRALKPPKQARLVQSSDKIGHHTETSDIVIICKALKKSKQAELVQSTLPLKLTSFDFAGQKHYKPMHHSFITSRAIYVIAFNARQLVSGDQIVVNHSIQEIKFWINSIRVYTNANCKVVLVGTHKGPYDGATGDDLTEEEKKPFFEINPEEIEVIDNHLKKHFDTDYYNLVPFTGNRIMALVESSIPSENNASGASMVREKLHRLGDNHPKNKKDLPISYLHLEAKITEKRSDIDSVLIHRKIIEQWVKDCGIEDCETALNFFHDIGIIVDPGNLPNLFLSDEQMKPLHDVVLIKPQWLADVMKELMNIDRGDDKLKPEGDDMQKALRQFEKEGKADKKLVLYPLWREYHNGSEKVFEQICLLLEAYGLIVPIQQSDCYYVLSKLPQTVKDIPRVTMKNCHKVSVSLKDGLSPPFLLHHLMFLMYQSIQNSDDDDDNNCFFDKGCYMEYLADCQWWLSQSDPSNSNIDVTIRTKEEVRTILPAMQLLHTVLLRIVEKKELKGIKYKLGPITTCSKCEEECLFTYITYSSGGDPTSKINKYLQCGECRSKLTILPSAEMIKSKTYSYGKPLSDFKDDLKFDELDTGLRGHLVESFKKNVPNSETISSDTKVLQEWYECNQDDPWPLVVKYLSNYENRKDADTIINKLNHEYIYMCEV